MQDPPAGISGAPQDNNIMLWNAVIFGPDDTPWDGGKEFKVFPFIWGLHLGLGRVITGMIWGNLTIFHF
jgi:hypothetical protein